MQIILTANEVRNLLGLSLDAMNIAMASGVVLEEAKARLEEGTMKQEAYERFLAKHAVTKTACQNEQMMLSLLKLHLGEVGVKGVIEAKINADGEFILTVDEWTINRVVKTSRIWLSIFTQPAMQVLKLTYQVGRVMRAWLPDSKESKRWEEEIQRTTVDIAIHMSNLAAERERQRQQ
jgi:hypothetical protein